MAQTGAPDTSTFNSVPRELDSLLTKFSSDPSEFDSVSSESDSDSTQMDSVPNVSYNAGFETATEALPILKFKSEATSISSAQQHQQSNYELLTENFISVLNKVGDCPFAVYCMSGNARLGKSYTLNFFIRQFRNQEIVDSSQLFKWRKGTQRETVGINLWPEPFFMTDKNERKIGVLLMDAQGLFDKHTTLQENSVIFALSSLFSTVGIFNVSKQIQLDTLQHVNFFTGYARAIGHRRNNQGDLDDDSERFQRLVIMVRDFENNDEFGFGYHDNTTAPLNLGGQKCNYFHEKFPTAVRNPSMIPYENLAVINGICKNYDNVGVILHPDPGSKFKSNPTDEKPKKEFLKKSKEFVDLMLSPGFLVTKKVGGQELSGVEFIPYVEHLGGICKNAGEHFPTAKTIAESASIMSHTLARTNAYLEFTESITTSLGQNYFLSDAELSKAYEEAKQLALVAFHKIKKLGGKDKEQETLNFLLEKCQAKFESLKQVYILSKQVEEGKREREIQSQEIANLTRTQTSVGGNATSWVTVGAVFVLLLASLILVVPSMLTFFESATSTSHTLARNTAFQEFTERITVSLAKDGLSNEQLLKVYDEAEKSALKVFNRMAKLGTTQKQTETLNSLLSDCKAKFHTLKEVYFLSQKLKEEQKRRMIQSEEIKKLKQSDDANAARVWELEKQAHEAREKGDAYPIVKISVVAACTFFFLMLTFCTCGKVLSNDKKYLM